MKKIALLAMVSVVLIATAVVAAEKREPAGNFYEWTVRYLHEANKTLPAPLGLPEQGAVSGIDFLLSTACLYVALWVCTGTKGFLFKKYLWFLLILNLSWFIFLILFRGGWEILDFLVIKLQPDLKDTVWNHFAFTVVLTPVFLYVWLIARTFSLKFYGAFGTALISQALYFLIIYLFFVLVPAGENHGLVAVKNNLGITAVVQSYLNDINNITLKRPLMSLIRVRPFRL